MAKISKKLKKYGFSAKNIISGLIVMVTGNVTGSIVGGISSLPEWFEVVRMCFSIITAVLAIILLLYMRDFIKETRENFDIIEENFKDYDKDFDELAKEVDKVKTNTQVNSLVQVLQVVKELFVKG